MVVPLPNLEREYGRTLPAVFPGQWDFRLDLLRVGAEPLRIDDVAETFAWEDSGAVLTGSISLQRPYGAASLPVGVGHRVRCQVRWKGGWYTLWQMRVQPFSVDLTSGALDVPLSDDLVQLTRNRRRWSFRKTKRRPRGWYAHEVAREVARRSGVEVGSLARGSHRIGRLVRKNATDLDILRAAYGREREKSGVRFVIRMRDGKLEVLPLRRNQALIVLREQIEEALVELTGHARPVTVIRARGHVGKGSGAKKVTFTAYDGAILRRFGRSEDEKDYGRVDSEADLRARARRDLARRVRIKRTATLTVPGIPFIRRGDLAQWVTTEPGWSGSSTLSRDRSYVYVTSASHAVSAAGYALTLSVVQDDPYLADQKRQDREARERAKARRKKTT